jgi:hypothetical protein
MESPGQRIIRLEAAARLCPSRASGHRLRQAYVQPGARTVVVASSGKPSALGRRLRMRVLGSTHQGGRFRSAECG